MKAGVGTGVGVGDRLGMGCLMVSAGILLVLFPAGVQLISINIDRKITMYLKKFI